MKIRNILTTQNAKTSKGEDLGYLTGILYLAPSNIVKGINVCPLASKGCRKSCLYYSGRGRFSSVQNARIAKTELFRDDINLFMQSLVYSIKIVERKAKREGLKPCIRLNGTSDISYEKITDSNGLTIFDYFPNVQFYDYTKDYRRLHNNMPNNYHLTYSYSESKYHQQKARIAKMMGYNVAVVFSGMIPPIFWNKKTIDGTTHDLRFLDKSDVVVGLTPKGKEAKQDKSGFVVNGDLYYEYLLERRQ